MITTFFIIALLGTPSVQELIDAKRWDEAAARLDSLSLAAQPRFEGLIAQGRGKPAEAAKAFERALVATPKVPQLHVHAAHAYLKMKRFETALKHARAASALKDTAIAQPLLEARALMGLGRDAEAYVVLNRACSTFRDEPRPWLELAMVAHRNQLAQEVYRAAEEVLARSPDRDAVVALFYLLYGVPKALPLLEQTIARHPTDPELRAHLGHAYAGNRRWFSAARLFESATALGGHYAFEAADQYRMASRYRDALRMNGQVPPSARQTAQRVSILFEQKKYARIVAMNTSFTEPDASYRVAYAHYAVGDNAGATRRARGLLKTAYQDEAAALLKAIGLEQAQ